MDKVCVTQSQPQIQQCVRLTLTQNNALDNKTETKSRRRGCHEKHEAHIDDEVLLGGGGGGILQHVTPLHSRAEWWWCQQTTPKFILNQVKSRVVSSSVLFCSMVCIASFSKSRLPIARYCMHIHRHSKAVSKKSRIAIRLIHPCGAFRTTFSQEHKHK